MNVCICDQKLNVRVVCIYATRTQRCIGHIIFNEWGVSLIQHCKVLQHCDMIFTFKFNSRLNGEESEKEKDRKWVNFQSSKSKIYFQAFNFVFPFFLKYHYKRVKKKKKLLRKRFVFEFWYIMQSSDISWCRLVKLWIILL